VLGFGGCQDKRRALSQERAQMVNLNTRPSVKFFNRRREFFVCLRSRTA
jgi:hypothetical protein